ncbi:MAG: patatin-like phospholipase family protein [Campylobacterota bacterium]|nr:patatin-like phospholipase family protein [Campylobacterota bacterium]
MRLSKLFLITTLLFTSLSAQERPKIALVLSGGGAKGAAHVGVMKILEKNRVPVDMIVGTSMGSFMGGLYASGKSPQEIEELLSSVDWKRFITADFNRQDMPMRRKDVDYTYQGRLGLGINADNELVLPTGVLKREPYLMELMSMTENVQDIKDFDKLPIPFRAVATNIRNGDKVILKGGSLAKSIYASSSIPGGFQPINIDGVDLVDGGVSSNFPIEVARDMGADIIIAVDVSQDFSKDLDVSSYLVVMGQLVDILTRKNVEESISTLNKKDILLVPDVGMYGALEADKYAEIVVKGVDVALKSEHLLKALSLSDEEYSQYRSKHHYSEPVIDEIKIINQTYISDESIRKRVHQEVGSSLDEKVLREDLMHLYNMTIFDGVSYELEQINGKNILSIITTPSWDNHGEVRFAIGLEDDFKGHSAYSLKVGYTMFGLNSFGGEWKNDFEIGNRQRAYTEIFQPLDSMQRYYLRPFFEYKSLTDLVPINEYLPTEFGNRELKTSRYGAGFAFGMHVTTDYEFEVGISSYRDNVTIESQQVDNDYKATPAYVSFKSDSLDNIHFPEVGLKLEVKWTKELSSMDSDYDYEQIYVELEKPLTLFANNITAYFKYGTTYNIVDSKTALAGSYTLGGLFNLSGYAPYSLNDDNMILGVVRYRYQLKDGGFFGTLNSPLYAGFSLESGQVWGDGDKADFNTLHNSATIYVAADTFLGPFYLAYGFSDDGEQSGYLYLGEKF